MWPLVAFAVILAACNRVTEPESKPEPSGRKTEPIPPASQATPSQVPSASASVSANVAPPGPPCTLSRDEFIRRASNPITLKADLRTKKFAYCFVEPKEAQEYLGKVAEKLDQQPGLAPLEEVSLMTLLAESRYTARVPGEPSLQFYFRPDLPSLAEVLQAHYKKVSETGPRRQVVFVDIDLSRLFVGHVLPKNWEKELREDILSQISENYRGDDAKKLPNLVFTDKKPSDKTPYTTVLISDRDGNELINAKHSRKKSALVLEMSRVSLSLSVPNQARDFAYKAFREKYQVPEAILDAEMVEHVLKQDLPARALPSGLYLSEHFFDSEFGNVNIQDEVLIFADQMKREHFVDLLLQSMPQDKVKHILSKTLAYLATHELAHSLGLMHWEEPHNLMRANSLDFNPAQHKAEHFNDAQKAYFEAILGPGKK